ncbi:PREDICTED: uncharacterized protein LOC106106821 [Papilio polytes]|uniref:uncharacterized protein LOC106106821 n=1 Tax=Papilio polytes TaxID=76194 RepID=UPI0006761B85|nr:PREDICTED: uncharacterized protein LOC106106821 [Papilio polytes]
MSLNNQPCRVWSRFERKKKDGSVLKFRIQDPPVSAQDGVKDFIVKYFLTEETFQKAAGISSNPEAVEEYQGILEELIKLWIVVICCYDNDSEEVGDILGVSIVDLFEDETFDGEVLQIEENRKLFYIVGVCENLVQPLMKGLKGYHSGRGITVHPDCRGLGIATEFVKIRRQMINEQNVPMSCAWMTSYGSQRAAEKDNWETLFEIAPEELGQKCGVVFKDSPRTFKLMFVRNSNSTKQCLI